MHRTYLIRNEDLRSSHLTYNRKHLTIVICASEYVPSSLCLNLPKPLCKDSQVGVQLPRYVAVKKKWEKKCFSVISRSYE